ncbi:hypothetical protein FA15DRAFT_687246 [Coprinopsis marcescibilis]|uniref:Peptidase S9 prolyl oligopeptidase catalytic domain-containing protein n=1 Tax=Coprinopsis marcescibilis TaxID=230819 RepID=A0A5C3KY18_COPMA|nr:hypothetical protein FA15DRAFT_687246 [Coprinopsis marcescibilis]
MQILMASAAAEKWKLELHNEWDVLGPFPVHAREQHYISPAFPLDLSKSVDFSELWPSYYADGGQVGWTKTTSNGSGQIRVSFPNVRWKYLRSFEGWASLQHHAVLHTTFKLTGKAKNSTASQLPNILADLVQGSYFTVIPVDFADQTVTPRWYAGNIYAMERGLPHVLELPPTNTGEYHLFISGDYEIRLFGDPDTQGSAYPEQIINLGITLDIQNQSHAYEPTLNVVPNFIDGYSFGNALGIGLRGLADWINVDGAAVADASDAAPSVSVSLLRGTRVGPGQTRVIPLFISQTLPFTGSHLKILLNVNSIAGAETVAISLPVKHLGQWSESSRAKIIGSFFFSRSTPSLFSALPPLDPSSGSTNGPPIVALHGAGVDIVEMDLWANAMPLNKRNWILMPAGRTSWVNPSTTHWAINIATQDVWESLTALSDILSRNAAWKDQSFPASTRVLLIGHSNGGQGAWHIASHYPDRVIAAVPAAGYIKSQAYVPLTHSRSARFVDPALRAILETSLTPDDNDLHLSNLVHKPILAVHGGADENVPSWHSRTLVNVLQDLSRELGTDIRSRLKEDPGKGHWYSSVLNNEEVVDFLDKNKDDDSSIPDAFTLTVSSPQETGSLYRFVILKLTVPGRLGKLTVTDYRTEHLRVSLANVDAFGILPADSPQRQITELHVDGTVLKLPDISGAAYPTYIRRKDLSWEICDSGSPQAPSAPPVRLQSVLTSSGPLTIVFSDKYDRDLAIRLAHDLQLYHRLDSDLISEEEAISRQASRSWGSGNIVVIGGVASKIVDLFLKEHRTPFRVEDGRMVFQHQSFPGRPRVLNRDSGSIFLHPHPSSYGGVMLFMAHSGLDSLERLGKLFPIRTGVAAPAWVIAGPSMDRLGASGLEGAGVWGCGDRRSNYWNFVPESSWFGEEAFIKGTI